MQNIILHKTTNNFLTSSVMFSFGYTSDVLNIIR